MKLYEFITEAPLQDYQTIGDFTRSHGFRHEIDRKLLTHPTNIQKLHNFFARTPFNFRIFAINKPGAGKFQEYGPMTYDVFEANFGEEIANKVFNDPDDEESITVVFVGNRGAEREMMTPWIMAHRFGHAIQAGQRFRDNTNYAWRETGDYFFKQINHILNDYYIHNRADKVDTRSYYALKDAPKYSALFNAIGTMRSARTDKIKRPYEFLYECFAQYLQSGNVKFNPLPVRKEYGRRAWGRATQALHGRNITDEANEDLQQFAEGLEDHFAEVLRSAQGQVYVM